MAKPFSTKIQLFALAVAVSCLFLWMGINIYAEDRTPCADDVSKFCKGIEPGGGRIANCLKEHEKDLSLDCKKRTEETIVRAKEAHKACADDIDEFCKDAQPGKGNIARCLREHKSELSPECKEGVGKEKHRRD